MVLKKSNNNYNIYLKFSIIEYNKFCITLKFDK